MLVHKRIVAATRRLFRLGSDRSYPSASYLLAGLLLAGCTASSTHILPPAPAPLRVQAEEGHSEEEGAGTQGVAIFIGGSNQIGGENGFTYGFDYEYMLGPVWGIGAFVESVDGLERSESIGIQAYWHPVGELIVTLGPGMERHDDEWEPIARVGVLYEFPIGDGWSLLPGVFYDVTKNEDILIYGLNLSYKW